MALRGDGGGRPALVALRALGLGDLLTGVPALRGLARAFPEHRLILAAPRALAPLARLVEAVDQVVDVGALEPLPLRLHGADVAVNLHGRGPQSTRLLLDSEPSRLIAFDLPGAPAWRPDEHEVARWCRLLAESGVPADPRELDLEVSADSEPGATVIHPGAASAARRWPAERFAAVARAEAAAGRRVLVTGGPDDEGLARSVATLAGLGPGASLAGRTGLAQLTRVVASAGRVVCGDTGVAHLATALGTPSVLLFGPTSPHAWGPPPDRPRHVVLWAGRTGDPHADRPDPGLLEISVEEVLAALARVPSVAAASGEPAVAAA